MNLNLFLFFFLQIVFQILSIDKTYSKGSVSQNNKYPQFCLLAAQDDTIFQSFRRNPIYCEIVETLHSYDYGRFFLHEINKTCPHLLQYLNKICLEDSLGNPISFHYPQIGTISPTILRYVKVMGDLQREFGDLSSFNIIEIGGGFGGQCKIINNISGFNSYTIIDLPECIPLIKKYLSFFDIKNFRTIDSTKIEPLYSDLVISNYAFSEIDRIEQLEYFDKIIRLAHRGYMIYNHFPQQNPLSIYEFIELLKQNKKIVKIIKENPSYVGDIIIWHS